MSRNVFVYGTLRRDMGYPLITLYEGKASSGLIKGDLYSFGSFPGVVKTPHGVVKGQLIDYSDLSNDEWEENLNAMDRYEGSGFSREITRVVIPMGDETEAWVYYPKRPEEIEIHYEKIPSGDWKEFVDNRYSRRF